VWLRPRFEPDGQAEQLWRWPWFMARRDILPTARSECHHPAPTHSRARSWATVRGIKTAQSAMKEFKRLPFFAKDPAQALLNSSVLERYPEVARNALHPRYDIRRTAMVPPRKI